MSERGTELSCSDAGESKALDESSSEALDESLDSELSKCERTSSPASKKHINYHLI